MNLSGVFRQLAICFSVLGLAALACSFYANAITEPEASRGLLLTGMIAVFTAACCGVLVQDIQSRTGPREAIWFILLFWILTPVMTCLPFLTTGIAPTLANGVFESTSNLTTIGISAGDVTLPDSIRVWRSCLQFIGGVINIGVTVVLLAALNLIGPGIHRSHFFTTDRTSIFKQFNSVVIHAALIFGAAIFIAVVVQTMLEVTTLDAITRSVAAITTSTTTAEEGNVEAFFLGPSLILSALLFIGATNVVLHIDLVKRGRWRSYLSDNELLALVIGLLCLGSLLALQRKVLDGRLFIESLSFLSTSGMSITGVSGVLDWAPAPIPEMIAFVGGAALSTAGGVKIARLLVLMRRASAEFQRLAFVHAKVQMMYKGQARKDAVAIAVWVYILAYIGVTVLVALGLTLNDIAFDSALSASIGATSNIGSLVEPAINERGASTSVMSLLTLAAILGRIEILALAPLFTVGFWRK